MGEVIVQGHSHSLGLRSLGPVMQRVVMTGDYVGCSGWPYLLWCSDVPYACHDALLNCLSGHWILLLISSTWSTRTVFTCEVEQNLSHQGCKTCQLPSPGLAHLSKQFTGVWLLFQLLGATCESWVLGGDQRWMSYPEKTWQTPPPRGTTPPHTPK